VSASIEGKHVGVESSRIAIRALVHPLSLTAIGLLALNDHVFKAGHPGVVTGKLSDVAGLVFFPLLLAIVLGVFVRKPGRTLLASCVISGGWFASVNTIPVAALATERLMAVVWPWRITMDPTDLVALPALGVAAVAWRRAQAPRSLPSRSRVPASDLQIGVIVMAAVVSLATSCVDTAGVRFIERHGLSLFAVEETATTSGFRATSVDGGLTWTDWTYDSSPSLSLEGQTVREDCLADSPDHCFRIDGGSYVEESVDGGASWSVAWQVPPGRGAFLARSGTDCDPYEVAAVDLFITDPPDSLVLVAMSDDGLLRRDPTGVWERDVLGMAASLFATNSRIAQEWFVAFAVMLVAALTLTVLAHRRLSTAHSTRIGAWPTTGLVVLGLAAVLSVQRSLMVDDDLTVPYVSGGVIILSLIGLAGAMAIWSRLHARRPQTARSHALVSLAGTLAIGASLVAPFVAWSSGTIARWETAALTAGVTSLVVIRLIWWRIARIKPAEEPFLEPHAQPAAAPQPTEEALTHIPSWTAAALTVVGLVLVRPGTSLLFIGTVAAAGFVGAAMVVTFLAARRSGYRRPAAMTLLAVAASLAPGLTGAYGFAAIALRPTNRWAIVARVILLIPVLLVMFTISETHIFQPWMVLTPLLVIGIDWTAARLNPTPSTSKQQDSNHPAQGRD
jgi:hypothetical protein